MSAPKRPGFAFHPESSSQRSAQERHTQLPSHRLATACFRLQQSLSLNVASSQLCTTLRAVPSTPSNRRLSRVY